MASSGGVVFAAKQATFRILIFILAKKKKTELYFDNFFNFPALVAKLFDKGIYCIGTVRIDRKNMAVMKKYNTMK